jgi:hypothetical protein
LGQYAVVWRDGRPTILGEDSPVEPRLQPHPDIAGKGQTLGDLVAPIVDDNDWECLTNDRGGQPCLVPVKQSMMQELLTGRIRLV